MVIGTNFWVFFLFFGVCVRLWFRPLRWAEPSYPPVFNDAVLPGKMWEENRGTALYCSGHLLLEAVLGVGKAVWYTIVLSNLPGPAEPLNIPLFSFLFFFLSDTSGEQSKVASVTVSSELCHQNFENVLFLLYVFICCLPTPLSHFIVLIIKGLCGCLQAGTKCCRLKSELWPSCG